METSSQTKICPYCRETIRADAIKCRYCKEILDDDIRSLRARPGYEDFIESRKPRQWSPGVAVLLSFLIPGLGQMYKGHFVSGILWLIFTPVLVFTVLIAGILVYIACLYDAAVRKVDR